MRRGMARRFIASAMKRRRKERPDDETKSRSKHHLRIWAVHGFLHLIGYDHDKRGTTNVTAREKRSEKESLAQLGIPDPYAGSRSCAKAGGGMELRWRTPNDPRQSAAKTREKLPGGGCRRGEVRASRRRQLDDACHPQLFWVESRDRLRDDLQGS